MYATDRHRLAVVTLKIHNSCLGATHMLTHIHLCLGFDPYLGTTVLDQRTNRCVKLQRQVFLTFSVL